MNKSSSNIHYYDSIIVDIVDDNVLLLGPVSLHLFYP
jgi:hypothetical protein